MIITPQMNTKFTEIGQFKEKLLALRFHPFIQEGGVKNWCENKFTTDNHFFGTTGLRATKKYEGSLT